MLYICNDMPTCSMDLQSAQKGANKALEAYTRFLRYKQGSQQSHGLSMMQTELWQRWDADLELEVTQEAPQKNMAKAGSVMIPMTTFVLPNLACMTGDVSCHAPGHASIE